ncbi:MAG TPA: hypothetical protein VHP36_10095 [Chitinispirillaceae bacterium]|nr:hypothetical protein [Chitinispirillaceae bacterium]
MVDTLKSTVPAVDSITADTLPKPQQTVDTLSNTAVTDTFPQPQQVAKPTEKKEKTKLVKRNFNSRQQVGLGIGMMIFIAVIMTTAQSWNPKN